MPIAYDERHPHFSCLTMRLSEFLDRSARVASKARPARLTAPVMLAFAALMTTGCDRTPKPATEVAASRPALDADLLRDLQMVQEVPLRQAEATFTPGSDAAPVRATVRRAPRAARPVAAAPSYTPRAATDPAVAAALADPAYAAGPSIPSGAGEGVSPDPMVRAIQVPAGTMSSVRLSDALSNKTHKPGDLVIATLAEDIFAEDGTTLLPSGLPVILRLREMKHAENARSATPVVLDLVALRIQGQTVPLRGVASAMPDLVDRGLTAGQVGKIGVGAAAGAVIGDMVGGRTSTIVGGVVGGLAGRHVAGRTADYDVMLSVDSQIQLRLDQTLSITLRQAGFDPASPARVIR